MVVNLAAGLDTRPYRMALPAALQWSEVDLPGILKKSWPVKNRPALSNASASIYLTPLPAASSSPNSARLQRISPLLPRFSVG